MRPGDARDLRPVFLGIALLLLPLVLSCTHRRASPHERRTSGPVLVLERGAPAPSAKPEALAIALRLVPASERRALADALDDLQLGVDVAKNPFVADLGDSPTAALEALAPSLLPAIGAAENLARGVYETKDGHATLAESCPPHAHCVALDENDDASDAEAARARFAAWAWSRSLRVAATASSLDALRARASTNSSTIALVVDPNALSGPEPEDVKALRQKAKAIDDALRAHGGAPELVTLLARAPERVQLPIDPRGVRVVPRLGALARTDDFAREVHQLAGRPSFAF